MPPTYAEYARTQLPRSGLVQQAEAAGLLTRHPFCKGKSRAGSRPPLFQALCSTNKKMNTTRNTHQLKAIMPFFIVEDMSETIGFYTEKLSFEVEFKQTLKGDQSPLFCILNRDGASIMFKYVAREVKATPNSEVHDWAPIDAYIATHDPDSLYTEFKENGVEFHRDLEVNHDGLRGFDVKDNNGYVIRFARPN